MNLQSLPNLSNSGFLPKSAKVTYQRPVMQREELGSIPYAPPGSPLLEEGFVPSSKEEPAIPPGLASRQIERDNPQLDASGQPVMETVTEKFVVPGPKAEALADIALGGVLGATAFSVPGLFLMGLGVVGTLFGAPAAGQLLDNGGRWLVGGAAVGGAVGLGLGALDASPQFSKTNTLEWTERNITHAIMLGYERKNPVQPGEGTQFEPVFQSQDFGQWKAPIRNYP